MLISNSLIKIDFQIKGEIKMISYKQEQGDQLGSTYPIAVSYQGFIGEGQWKVWNILTNKVYEYYTSCKSAHSLAKLIKDNI